MVGAKLWIPVVHLEAGLRSRDRRMPEEINRLVTDAIADVLWTPSRDGDANLLAEGVPAERIECIGNIMIDSYEMMRAAIEARPDRRVPRRRWAATTASSRCIAPRTWTSPTSLAISATPCSRCRERLPLVFAVHPRTRKKLAEFGLEGRLAATAGSG